MILIIFTIHIDLLNNILIHIYIYTSDISDIITKKYSMHIIINNHYNNNLKTYNNNLVSVPLTKLNNNKK